MKNLFKLTLAVCAFAAVVSLGACSKDDGDTGTVVTFKASGDVAEVSVLEAYAADVVIARYENLEACSEALYDAVAAITESNQSSQIGVAATAWIAARQAWERTEAYLFGPVDNYSIDPGIDSWPLALASLADFIESDPSAATIKNDNGEMKGFHTIEFLLFDNGSAKTDLTDFNLSGLSGSLGTDVNNDTANLSTYDSDLEALDFDEIHDFLKSITTELWRNTARLLAEWDEDGALNEDVVAANVKLGSDYEVTVNGGGDYYSDFTSAGDDEVSSYSSLSDALSVILESAAGIASEVGELKIGDPYSSKNVLDVESWFSWNSVIDFTDNIVGIKEAYYGTLLSGVSVSVSSENVVTLSSGVSSMTAADDSISAYIASGSASLDEEIKEAISEAIDAVSSLEYPFRSNLSSSTIEPAMDACAALEEALTKAQMAVNDGWYIE